MAVINHRITGMSTVFSEGRSENQILFLTVLTSRNKDYYHNHLLGTPFQHKCERVIGLIWEMMDSAAPLVMPSNGVE